MAKIYIDANVVIDYARERALHQLGVKSTGTVLRRHLGESLGEGRVSIPMVAYNEAKRNLRKDVMHKINASDAEVEFTQASFLIKRLRLNVCKNNFALVDEVRKMYDVISRDPRSQNLARWRSLKSRHVARPSLGLGNDAIILSTAAQHAKRRQAELWTRDIDFTMFADEIGAAFNVEVVDTSRLGERFVG